MTRKFILWTSCEEIDKLFQLGRLYTISAFLFEDAQEDGGGVYVLL